MTRYMSGEVEVSRATDEQLRLAQLLADDEIADPHLEEKIQRVKEVTGNRNQEYIFSVLHDCEYNVNAAIELILEGSAAGGEWQSTTKKPKKKTREHFQSGPKRPSKQLKDAIPKEKRGRENFPKKGKPTNLQTSEVAENPSNTVAETKWESNAVSEGAEWGPAKAKTHAVSSSKFSGKSSSKPLVNKGTLQATGSSTFLSSPPDIVNAALPTEEESSQVVQEQKPRPYINSKVIENPNKPAIAWSQITKQKPPQVVREAVIASGPAPPAPVQKPIDNLNGKYLNNRSRKHSGPGVSHADPETISADSGIQLLSKNPDHDTSSRAVTNPSPISTAVHSERTSLKQPARSTRPVSQGRHVPTEAVVVPESSSASPLDVQFGSLGIGFSSAIDTNKNKPEKIMPSAVNPPQETKPSASLSSHSAHSSFPEVISKGHLPPAPVHSNLPSQLPSHIPTGLSAPVSVHGKLPHPAAANFVETAAAADPSMNPIAPNHIAFANHMHYQLPNNGFNMNHVMGTMPSYSPYDTADISMSRNVPMTYYDPSFQHPNQNAVGNIREVPPVVSTSSRNSGEPKHSVSESSNPTTSSQPQHNFPNSATYPYGYNPYNPYSYIPNQYQYQNSYGQPFPMNKHMYQMYNHSAKHSGTSSNHSNFQSSNYNPNLNSYAVNSHNSFDEQNNSSSAQDFSKPNVYHTSQKQMSGPSNDGNFKPQSFEAQSGFQKINSSGTNGNVSAGGNSNHHNTSAVTGTSAPSGSYYNQMSQQHPQQVMGGFPGSFVQQPIMNQPSVVGQQFQQRGHNHSMPPHQYWQQ